MDRPGQGQFRLLMATDSHDAIHEAVCAPIRQTLGWQEMPPDRACPWCGAAPWIACRVKGPARRTRQAFRLRSTPGGIHPARSVAA
jgi:hypothetical protein